MDGRDHEPVFIAQILNRFVSRQNRKRFCKANALFLTFIAYAAYCLSRRPIEAVNNSLNRNCSRLTPPHGMNISDSNRDDWCNWYPFKGSSANRLLGGMGYIYISSYAIAMFFSGMVAARTRLRYFLSFGMIFCGVFTYLFGVAYYANIHSYAYFVIVVILDGAVQSTGWPGVVACVGSWFGRNRRGVIFGVWSSHMFIGKILGSLVWGSFVKVNWGLPFTIAAVIVGGVGLFLFLFLAPHPLDVGCSTDDYSTTQLHIPSFISASREDLTAGRPLFFNPADDPDSRDTENSIPVEEFGRDSTSDTSEENEGQRTRPISFLRALKIPGILEYSMCLFFTELVIYSFVFWLTRYLPSRHDEGDAAYISTAFDAGGILGGITAGALLDMSETSALTSIAYLTLAIPFLLIYRIYGEVNTIINIVLLVICGALTYGPCILIITAVTADLGTHYTIEEELNALAIVAAIINGIGSIGAALGPLLAGFAFDLSWDNLVFWTMASNFCAVLCLAHIGFEEAKGLYYRNYHMRSI